ncbi:dehydrogenase/reductase SDR family member 1 isoform X4 [Rousettus aegyptiacus]|uniref:Dehydrogenase/reductase 1 n=1 Tax=Rousettus aegyptiacus TaxID=9407 RepID=A0A7J8IHA3_ROUAE|nr:dehydrogenase/reductase SDR family member 1 isoform X4 [Rousettus aegyptiacus]KAF6483987.1 dehydrogenase/reductase 1 [Rousettus aegyptiacus]
MAAPMKGQVCVVTGASRGIGRGIALQLCQAGATVYITGRHLDTLRATAQDAQSRGGRCIPVVCDSSQESEVRSLFEQVDREQQGRLDVLVNNAFAGVQPFLKNINKAFWETPASFWDDFNNAGLRGHYLCSVYGARLMVPAGRGLIVVISSLGGLKYIFNVPYSVGKAALEFQFSSAETAEMSGKCVVALATDPNILSLSGKVLPSCDLARRYGLQDVDGRPILDYLSLSSVISHNSSLGWLASYLPGFLRMPKWIMTLYASKF